MCRLRLALVGSDPDRHLVRARHELRHLPITVKKALTQVSGVSKTEVSLDRREATVTFDDAKTDVEALTRATKEAGYPSTVVGNAK